MAKSTGLGGQLFVDEFDLSGDVGSVGRIASPSGVLDVTAVNVSGHERIYSHYDGELTFNAFFNDAANQEHAALRARETVDRIVSYFQGSTIGNMAACMVSKKINYDGTRGADGSLTFDVQSLANAKGLDFCRMLTAGKRTDTAATNGASLDEGAAPASPTAFGLAAYLHVFSLSATDFTVTIQESSDDAVGDPFAAVTGGTFAVVTGVTQERIVTSLTQSIERYLRVATTGTLIVSVTFAVAVTRYPVA